MQDANKHLRIEHSDYEHPIVEYVRDKKRAKKGILFAGIHPDFRDKVLVGFTLCCKRDSFDADFFKQVAANRALKWKDAVVITTRKHDGLNAYNKVHVPASLQSPLHSFVKRIDHYYKDKAKPSWIKHFFPVDDQKGEK